MKFPREHVEDFTKIKKVNSALLARNVSELKSLATSSGGLLFDGLRSRVWPFLVRQQHAASLKERTSVTSECKPEDLHQITLDCARSFSSYPQELKSLEKLKLQKDLNQLIRRVLKKHPELSYYQGFHDICGIFLKVLGRDPAIELCHLVVVRHLHYYMNEDLSTAIQVLSLIYPLLQQVDPILAHHLLSLNVPSFFALSWILTWFSHDLEDYSKIVRLFDFFLSHGPLMSFYVSCAMVLLRRDDILYRDLGAPELHQLLRKIPETLDMEYLIQTTLKLYIDHPPSKFLKRRKANPILRDMIDRELYHETSSSSQDQTTNSIHWLIRERWYRFITGSRIVSALSIGLICWMASYIYYHYHLGFSD